QLDACRSTEVAQRVEGRPDRAAGEQDVVHEDDRRVVETFGGYPGGVHRHVWPAGQVVAVEGDGECAHVDLRARELADTIAQTRGERDASGGDAQEHHPPGVG